MRNQVLSWLLLMSLFQILSIVRISGQCLNDQRSLLLELKNNLVFDSSSKKLVNWNQSVDCCNWDGIVCDNSGHVISLDLENEMISGGIDNSSGLFGLRYLENLNLAFNTFNSIQIPTGLQNLTNLVYLNLSNAGFGGQVPIEISRMTNLVVLDLSSLFPGLEPLKLENPNLKMVVQNLTGLQELYLDAVPTLQTLDLSNNMLLSGTIKQFPRSSSFRSIVLSYTSFSGSLPDSIMNLRMLSRIDLSNCNFTGPIPITMANLTELLSRLNLASCNLSSFPDLRNQSRLTFLDLSNNQINGEIPSWVWNIGNGTLLHLNLSRNLLVDFQKPFNISLSLSVLDLHSNSLRGEFPMPPASSIYVDYSSNKFQHTIPPDIGNFISFAMFFSLSNNSLTGKIPESLCSAAYLQVLDLSGNNLNGSIPPCLVETITSLGVLNLGRNNISGGLPDTFSVNCSLKTLDLSINNLGGNIPLSMANCKSLEVVNVGNNKIYDRFPCMLKSSPSLRVLVLRNNRFHGDLRLTVTIKGLEMELVKILKVFTAIDFSCNNFSGTIPQTIGDLTSLYVLNFSHNALTGTIPSSVGNLTQLGSMDLSANQLTGEVPKELTSLTFLSFLNLSYNKLYGMIPTGSQFQTFSAASFAGNPGLCGFPLNTSCNSNAPAENSVPRLSKIEFDWQFIFTGLGFGVGASLIIAPLAFCEEWREKCNDHLDRFLKLIFPRYGFSYVRYDGKVEAVENIEDGMTDDDEDNDEEGIGDGLSNGSSTSAEISSYSMLIYLEDNSIKDFRVKLAAQRAGLMHTRSTKWTARASHQPHIDAAGMKAVAADGQNLDLITLLEHAQTNGALGSKARLLVD
ncbi:hypothetical protein DH2020_015168 [Rehmannia glutinosa]|uniref:Leucine-rich repeat-containing N-terminal plant-type domain-containing protein n=1 Tax=Rehmannia glutinosa TaxID=99300 RepID=A0ABR0WYK1_REHGL